jgi:transposase
MAMTIVESAHPMTGGVDTHTDVHVAAAVDANGGVLGCGRSQRHRPGSPRCTVGSPKWATWVWVGVEGTGAYGARLARFLRARDLEVIEVDRPNRQLRRRSGKSDTIDAVEAARAALSGRASGIAKSADDDVEAIRVLLVARAIWREISSARGDEFSTRRRSQLRSTREDRHEEPWFGSRG